MEVEVGIMMSYLKNCILDHGHKIIDILDLIYLLTCLLMLSTFAGLNYLLC